jgi:hypothetical protein
MIKNALVFTEDNNLHITKPNGLRYQFENVDKPNLGFDFDVVVYDNEEFKIVKYDDTKHFDENKREPLTDTDRDAIETYISNSEPPTNVNLNNQIIDELNENIYRNIEEMAQQWRFRDFNETIYAGREGSNHPFRSDARTVMEYADSVNVILVQVMDEIVATREDHLRDFDYYINQFPQPTNPNLAL